MLLLINTVLTSYIMLKQTPFNNLKNVIINSTPLVFKGHEYEKAKLNPRIQKLREKSIEGTGQPNCDIMISDKCYDIKHKKIIPTNKNIISPIFFETFQEKGENHLKNVLGELESLYSKKSCSYNKKLIVNLTNILKEKSLTLAQKNHIWNEIIAQHFENIPSHIKIPIIIPITNKTYDFMNTKKTLEKHHITNDVLENKHSARLAICGVLNKWNNIEYKKNAMIMTENELPLSFDNSLEID